MKNLQYLIGEVFYCEATKGYFQLLSYEKDSHKNRVEIYIKWLTHQSVNFSKQAYWTQLEYYSKYLTEPIPKDKAVYILYAEKK